MEASPIGSVTRVLSVGRCHKYGCVAPSMTLCSYRYSCNSRFPESHTLRLHASSSSPSLVLVAPLVSTTHKTKTKGFRRRLGALSASNSMADLRPSTVLVTGAGGRTGTFHLFPSCSIQVCFFIIPLTFFSLFRWWDSCGNGKDKNFV